MLTGLLQSRLWLVQLLLLVLLSPAFVNWTIAIFALLLLAKLPQLQLQRPPWPLKFTNLVAFIIVSMLLVLQRDSGLLHLMIHFLYLAAVLRLLGFSDAPPGVLKNNTEPRLDNRNQADFRQLNWVHYFLLACCFILHQSLAVTALIVMTQLLQLACHYQGFAAPAQKLPLKSAGKIALLFLPIWLGLFLMFPRLPPLWQLPVGQMAKTGLGDQLNPGSIERLVESDELAFRAEFPQQKPDNSDLYWRARIYEHFDGRSWRMLNRPSAASFTALTSASPQQISYQVIAEPHQQRHLFSLGIPQQVPAGMTVNLQGLVSSRQPLTQRLSYQLTSLLQAIPAEPAPMLAIYLQLPAGNPKTRELAATLLAKTKDPTQLVQQISSYLQQHHFSYTLTPPAMQGEQIDQFLFEYKAGFCSHYAQAATFLLRAAGVPSRIVGGYLGGEWRDNSSYLEVSQRDAHAWVEYLHDGRWQRFDPTLVVAPERLHISLEQLLDAAERLRLAANWTQQLAWSKQLVQYLEDLDYYWSRWVLGFDQQKQLALFARLKQYLATLQQLSWWQLTVWPLLVLSTIGLGLWLRGYVWPYWQARRNLTQPQWLARQLNPFAGKASAESMQQYLQRLKLLYPACAELIDELDRSYQQLIFAGDVNALPMLELRTKRLIRQLKQTAIAK